ncbi:MAG: ribonuclease Z [Desulfurococcaceae archaeon]
MNARIYFLGTGAAMPVLRSLPCIALKVDSNIYLFDVGEGCQSSMFRTGLSPLKVRAVFITHEHGDHFLGLPGLLQTMTLSKRTEQLHIVAPRGLKEALASMMKAGFARPGFKVELVEASPGFTFEDGKVAVTAFRVSHVGESYGYRVAVGKKSICYTGDTLPLEATIDNCRGVDVLIHDATFTSRMSEEAREQGHSTAADAARIALEAGAKLLVLFHVSARHSAEEVFFDAYRFFKNTIVAEDGLVLIL